MNRFDNSGASGPAAARTAGQRDYRDLSLTKRFRTCAFQICRQTRASVDDVNIDGHSGFIAIGNEPNLGDSLCEVGIQFQDDFIEWSVSFSQKPFPPPCDIAKELARQSIANSK